jgi:hypothetical protein
MTKLIAKQIELLQQLVVFEFLKKAIAHLFFFLEFEIGVVFNDGLNK